MTPEQFQSVSIRVLDTVMKLHGADLGSIQLLRSDEDCIDLAFQRGFEAKDCERLRTMPDSDADQLLGRPLKLRMQVAIEDTEAPDTPEAVRAGARSAGYRAVYCVPLINLEHVPLGIFALYFRQQRHGGFQSLPAIDLYIEQLAMIVSARRGEQRLVASEQRWRGIVENIPQLAWRASESGEWTWSSPQWMEYTGLSVEKSRMLGWLAAVHPDDRAQATAAWLGAAESRGFGMQYRLFSSRDGRYRWFDNRARPVLGDVGQVEWIGSSTDIDDLRAEQLRQDHQLSELQHRVRNILAIVRSIANRTGETSKTVEEYTAHLSGRIGALARAQAVVSRIPVDGADLEGLVMDELLMQATQNEQFSIRGPEMRLNAKAVEVLSLVVHELATNAVKYGALAQAGGRISVKWWFREGVGSPRLHFEWLEAGVRMVLSEPRVRGFGAELIERRIAYELRGEGAMHFLPGGIRCTIEIPLTEALTLNRPGGHIANNMGVHAGV